MKKILVFFLVMIMALSCLVSCAKDHQDQNDVPTDEELITFRIETFLNAYNAGDMDAVLECLDAKTRNTFAAMMDLLGGLAGSQLGFDIDLRDLFSLGIAMESDDFMKLQIGDIVVTDSKNAVATTTMDLTGAGVMTIYFYMVYENDGWYIHDMTDTPPSGNNDSAPQDPDDSGSSDASSSDSNGSAPQDPDDSGSSDASSSGSNDSAPQDPDDSGSSDASSSDSNDSAPQDPDDSGSSDTPFYYVTTYSNTSEYGMAGTYTGYNKTNFAVGSSVLLEATVNDGFNFEGWYLSEGWNSICLSTDLTYQYEMKASNASIEARYSYYTVNVGAEGDDYGMAGTYTKYVDEKVSVGNTVVLEATVNSGYSFEGWYAEGSNVCLSPDLRYEFVMKAEHVGIYARYAYYTVNTFASGDEYGTAGTYTTYQDKKFSVGETVVLEATANDGYNFEGWYYQNSDTCLSHELVYQFVMKAEDVYIEARYSYYTLTVESDTDESETAGTYTKKSEEKVSVGDTVTLTATVNDGYNFEGWYVRGSDVCLSKDLTYSFVMKAENVGIEARWSYYTVTVESYSDESGIAGTYSAKAEEKVSVGDTVTLTATVNKGYNFEGWYVRWSDVCLSKDLTYSFEMKAEDVFIEARYSYYTITVYDACSGWFGEQREVGKVSAGEEVTLVAPTYGGYRFEGWYINSGCVSTDSTYKFDMPNKDIYIEAIYSKIED